MLIICKQLEIIKNSIALDELDKIELQVARIQQEDIDESVQVILDRLQACDYATAVALMDEYIQLKNNALTPNYDLVDIDSDLDIKILEEQYQYLLTKKQSCINKVIDFNKAYKKEFGALLDNIYIVEEEIDKIIRFKKTEKLKKVYDNTFKELSSKKIELKEKKEDFYSLEIELQSIAKNSEEYVEFLEDIECAKQEIFDCEREIEELCQKAAKDKANIATDFTQACSEDDEYDSFGWDYNGDKPEPTDDFFDTQKKQLKLLYRKAVKLCHPDLVDESNKDRAHAIMIELNSVKERNNIVRLKEILTMLESGLGSHLVSDTIDNDDASGRKISALKADIVLLKDRIAAIESSEQYIEIKSIDDQEAFFREHRSELLGRLKSKKHALKMLRQPEEQIDENAQDFFEDK